jgi:hypothetical protein
MDEQYQNPVEFEDIHSIHRSLRPVEAPSSMEKILLKLGITTSKDTANFILLSVSITFFIISFIIIAATIGLGQ